jgi:2-iminobutanoate/2-iminopropanoate deaminase
MPKIESVYTPLAPPPGSYAQAVKYGGLLFVSGQTPEEANGTPLKGTIAQQTRLVLTNIESILKAGGSSLDRVLKVNIYLSDISLKPEMNTVYKEFFPVSPPARIAMAVNGLDYGADIEIDVIAACE